MHNEHKQKQNIMNLSFQVRCTNTGQNTRKIIFASQGFRSRFPLSSPLADWAGISDPRALDFYWMQVLLAASNQIAANNQSRKHQVYAVENVNTGRRHYTST